MCLELRMRTVPGLGPLLSMGLSLTMALRMESYLSYASFCVP